MSRSTMDKVPSHPRFDLKVLHFSGKNRSSNFEHHLIKMPGEYLIESIPHYICCFWGKGYPYICHVPTVLVNHEYHDIGHTFSYIDFIPVLDYAMNHLKAWYQRGNHISYIVAKRFKEFLESIRDTSQVFHSIEIIESAYVHAMGNPNTYLCKRRLQKEYDEMKNEVFMC